MARLLTKIGGYAGSAILAGVLACQPAPAQEGQPKTAGAGATAALAALRTGGNVIFMRHTPTDTAMPDRFPAVDLDDCSTQRPLSATGRRLASHIGDAFRKLRIPLGEVLASPYCRTQETAALAFGKSHPAQGLINTAYLTDREKAPTVQALHHLLSRPVPPGTNRVLVSHSSTLADGIGVFPRPEGVLLVFRPDGHGSFAHVATILPAELEALSRVNR